MTGYIPAIPDQENATLAFSTTALLDNGASFVSPILNLQGFTQVHTSVLSDRNGTLVVEFGSDVSLSDITRTLTIPYLSTDNFQMFAAPAFTPYVRYTFTCDEAGQTDFYLDTKILRVALSGQVLSLEAFISPTMVAPLTRSILAGVDDDNVFRNAKVTRAGDLQAAITDKDSGFSAIVTAGGGLKVNEQTHLAGEAFGSVALNTTKWNIDLTGSGTQDATGDGELSLDTGTTANSAVEIDSVDVARFIPANYNITHFAITIPDGASYAANNIRRWGAFNATSATCDGIYWELDSGVWYVAHCISGVATRIAQSSWNGAAALSFPTNSITANVYECEYNAGSIVYRVNGNVMHRENLLSSPYANNIHFPVGMSNTNTGGSTTDVSMKIRAGSIYTLGKGSGVDRPFYIAGTEAGAVIKTGAGHLGKVILARVGSGGGDAVVAIYDALSATNQIGSLAIGGDGVIPIDYDLTFNVGLFIVITGTGTLGTTVTFD